MRRVIGTIIIAAFVSFLVWNGWKSAHQDQDSVAQDDSHNGAPYYQPTYEHYHHHHHGH